MIFVPLIFTTILFTNYYLLTLQVQTYLKETWVPTLRGSIHQCLVDISKGWFNLEESNWEVYQGSKLKKLMELTKFTMQVH